MSLFADLPLLPTLKATLAERGITTPTEIQSKTLPQLLHGASLVGVAETGSGKTLSYALPVLHRLKTLENDGNPVSAEGSPRAVVIVPTRELGEQITRVFKGFTHGTRLRVRSVLGGTDFQIARRNVEGIFEVLVATPGRLRQLLDREKVQLTDVRTLVFDEADQILDQGFLPDAERIAGACPPDRQLVLFSATVSAKVQALTDKMFAGVPVIRTEGSHRLVETLTTLNHKVVHGRRFPLLEKMLKDPVRGGTLIFTNTREQCDKLADEIRGTGRQCVVYRGEMDKVERRANLKAFREGKVPVLISTDLASRGLDVEHVGRVINYHLPQRMENYLHRAGRTARAGRRGQVVNFVTERDLPLVKQLGDVRSAVRNAPLN